MVMHYQEIRIAIYIGIVVGDRQKQLDTFEQSFFKNRLSFSTVIVTICRLVEIGHSYTSIVCNRSCMTT